MNLQKFQGWAASEWRMHLTINLKSDIISLPTISVLKRYCQMENEGKKQHVVYVKSEFLEKQLKKHGHHQPYCQGRIIALLEDFVLLFRQESAKLEQK